MNVRSVIPAKLVPAKAGSRNPGFSLDALDSSFRWNDRKTPFTSTSQFGVNSTVNAMNREQLMQHLKDEVRALQSPRLEEAFRAVDRSLFVPKELQDEAYEDYALPIGYGATISQPTTVAFMLEKLDVRPGQKVLDIGSGSGYTTALLTHLVGPDGKVIGLEIIPELVELGRKNLDRYYFLIRANKKITGERLPEIRLAEKRVAGLPKEAPYDRILVSAAAERIPAGLIEQLQPDGLLVIPIGAEYEVQKIVRIHKRPGGKLETEEYPGFVFVPLRG